ncbi:MAG: hypothetical protein SFV21_06125 [Rhodospirillaceae bacterium]|nr:hypothetical protein [Rhodospirillaceae bacterium]
MADHWFVATKRGFGVRPANWKGWAAVAVFVAANVAVARLIVATFGDGLFSVALAVLGVGLVSFLFAVFCSTKTQGPWFWK